MCPNYLGMDGYGNGSTALIHTFADKECISVDFYFKAVDKIKAGIFAKTECKRLFVFYIVE